MSTPIILMNIGEHLIWRQESGKFLHLIIVQSDISISRTRVGVVLEQLLCVLGNKPDDRSFEKHFAINKIYYLCSNSLLPLSSILSSLDL